MASQAFMCEVAWWCCMMEDMKSNLIVNLTRKEGAKHTGTF